MTAFETPEKKRMSDIVNQQVDYVKLRDTVIEAHSTVKAVELST
jgi:hypothetical protein